MTAAFISRFQAELKKPTETLLVFVIQDHEERVNHARQPAEQREHEAEKKAADASGEQHRERREKHAKEEKHRRPFSAQFQSDSPRSPGSTEGRGRARGGALRSQCRRARAR